MQQPAIRLVRRNPALSGVGCDWIKQIRWHLLNYGKAIIYSSAVLVENFST